MLEMNTRDKILNHLETNIPTSAPNSQNYSDARNHISTCYCVTLSQTVRLRFASEEREVLPVAHSIMSARSRHALSG
jgi:hypothetical protein